MRGDYVRRIEDYNFMAVVKYTKGSTDYFHVCGGAIVSEHKIVTAAHCMTSIDSVVLDFGVLNASHGSYYSVNIPLAHVTKHPYYRDPRNANDIAVVEVANKIRFDSRVSKIKMVDKNHVLRTGTKVIMLGYTKSNDNNKNVRRSSLQYVESTIADFEACRQIYWEVGSLRINAETKFCVSLCDGVHCTNKGDSGGSLV